jgi:Mlc titration factor MtfA (ptsG expression regulator)
MTGNIILSGIVLLILAVAARKIFRVRRRRNLLVRPLPNIWRQMLEENIPLYRSLPQNLKLELHGLIHLFLDEKTFIGCRGQEITDHVKITIAAQACILLLNRPTKCYPRLSTIYVYPQSYIVDIKHHEGDGLIIEGKDVRLGESWHNGPVVLAWDSVANAACGVQPGQNVVLHEFAHQLDQEDGDLNGTPLLDNPTAYQTWTEVFGAEYENLCEAIDIGGDSTLDDYGATDPAEFFAVATEAFFESPDPLLWHHPRLYEELKNFYKLDPASWKSNA